jgi:ATP-dependent DNA ligase
MASLSLKSLAVPVGIEPMEAKLVSELPEEPGWQFEPKWDGFRCLAFRAGDRVDLRAKSGKPLGRYFPEVVAMLGGLRPGPFVIDGELAIPVYNTLSFDALQMRIHPAESRIKKLSVETPAILILFDMLLDTNGNSLIEEPLVKRRAALERFYKTARQVEGLKLSPYTSNRKQAERWLDSARGALDGVVAKRSDGAYLPGERAMLKVKRMRTADCVVGGFAMSRAAMSAAAARSLQRRGKLDHVGFTATITNAERAASPKLQTPIAPRFTGSAGRSDCWSTERTGEWEPVKPKLVVEVRYDHVLAAASVTERSSFAFALIRPKAIP